MAPHSSTLAWKIPWTEEPGRLQSMESLRVGHDERLNFHFSLPCIGKGNGNPLQCSCLENPRDGGAWWAAVYGVAQSQTRLKRLSSSSSKTYEDQKLLIRPDTYTGLKEAEFLSPKEMVQAVSGMLISSNVLNPIEPLKASVCFVLLLKMLLDILIYPMRITQNRLSCCLTFRSKF